MTIVNAPSAVARRAQCAVSRRRILPQATCQRERGAYTLSSGSRARPEPAVPLEAFMYKRIILAVDLADTIDKPKGLEQALGLAKAWDGELRLVNVQPVVPATFMEYVPADFDAEQTKKAVEALDSIIAEIELPPDRKSAAARAGSIYHELLEEASDWKADLIVVASHRPVMSDYLLGSNAKTIVRHAQCSVLVVR
jgi:nucleotide-binding universal stress UspA family protein